MSIHDPTSAYKEMRSCGRSLGESRDCAVIATAIVTGVDYDRVHKLMEANGRKKKRGTPNIITETVLEELGFSFTNVTQNFWDKQIYTLRAFERTIPEDRRFLVWITGHILAATEGHIHDWSRGRMHRFWRVVVVHPQGDDVPEVTPRSRRGMKKRQVRILGRSATSIIRWMGWVGYSRLRTRLVLTRFGVYDLADSTINSQWRAGRDGLEYRGEIPSLTQDEAEELRKAASNV